MDKIIPILLLSAAFTGSSAFAMRQCDQVAQTINNYYNGGSAPTWPWQHGCVRGNPQYRFSPDWVCWHSNGDTVLLYNDAHGGCRAVLD